MQHKIFITSKNKNTAQYKDTRWCWAKHKSNTFPDITRVVIRITADCLSCVIDGGNESARCHAFQGKYCSNLKGSAWLLSPRWQDAGRLSWSSLKYHKWKLSVQVQTDGLFGWEQSGAPRDHLLYSSNNPIDAIGPTSWAVNALTRSLLWSASKKNKGH